ncbi:MAG: winged helix-turn-helix transcriptional regulator [Blastochloris sp.]|nr:winged helix-turn-helix transcriptional regulator [Blastochloris sp.]
MLDRTDQQTNPIRSHPSKRSKIFSDPLRQQIIELLLEGARTVKQIASQLDLPPTKLYYHINLLEEHGLIQVSDTRIVSGIIEKQYRSIASEFRIARQLLTPGVRDDGGERSFEGLDATMQYFMDYTLADLRRGLEQGLVDTSENAPTHRKLLFGRALTRMTPDRAIEFYARLKALMIEFDDYKHEPENIEQPGYALVIGIYPSNNAISPDNDEA